MTVNKHPYLLPLVTFLSLLTSSLIYAQSKNEFTLLKLNPDDSQASKLAISAVTLKEDGSNVTVTATIHQWPNVLNIQKEQWHTNGAYIFGFLAVYNGTGRGVAVTDTVSWCVSNVRTQDLSNLSVLQFPDLHLKYKEN